ncbi:condensation domain-containing protein, partial [Streptomyces sp. WAC 06725]|uniref:condensation domain-containing protein n=1 Tax=Streptomyces sp. WAC 06725 TaxID=2203209 RepID=UPI0021AD7424
MTETEHQVVELAEEILGTTGLGLGDRWIASGGDSLKALRFCFAVRQRWGCALSQAAVLHGDLAAVARSVATVRPGEEPALPTPVVSGARSAPATSEQQRLWLLQRRTPGSRAYSVNQVFRVDGPVDTAGLRRALRGLVTRHEALRTSFGLGLDGLAQCVVATRRGARGARVAVVRGAVGETGGGPDARVDAPRVRHAGEGEEASAYAAGLSAARGKDGQ